MRRAGVGRILYASGSGIYGDLGELEIDEDHGPVVPISTYGASKLAFERALEAEQGTSGTDGRPVHPGDPGGNRRQAADTGAAGTTL